MIEKKFAPNINLFERMQPTKLDTGVGGIAPFRMNRVEKLETNDFKSVFSGLVENFNRRKRRYPRCYDSRCKSGIRRNRCNKHYHKNYSGI